MKNDLKLPEDPFRRMHPECYLLNLPTRDGGVAIIPSGGYGHAEIYINFEIGSIGFRTSLFHDLNKTFAYDCGNYTSLWISWFGENHAQTLHELFFVDFDGSHSNWSGPFPTDQFEESLYGPCTLVDGDCLYLNPELGSELQFLYVVTPICEAHCVKVLKSPPDPPEPPPTEVAEAVQRYPWGVINSCGSI